MFQWMQSAQSLMGGKGEGGKSNMMGGDIAFEGGGPSEANAWGGSSTSGTFIVGGAAISGTQPLAWLQAMAPFVVVGVAIWLAFRK